MRMMHKKLIFGTITVMFALSLVMLAAYPKRVDNSSTPLSFGVALVVLLGIWAAISFKLLKRSKYNYEWYPPSRI
ncbi:MAG: hypothetical protein V1678_00245 [Candidatus Aenigmatarchaeota archaeon]